MYNLSSAVMQMLKRMVFIYNNVRGSPRGSVILFVINPSAGLPLQHHQALHQVTNWLRLLILTVIFLQWRSIISATRPWSSVPHTHTNVHPCRRSGRTPLSPMCPRTNPLFSHCPGQALGCGKGGQSESVAGLNVR